MTDVKRRCMICAKEKAFEGSICRECEAMIRGEAAGKKQQIRKDAERELRKEGLDPEKKK
jgi:hypothetical protein